MNQDYDDYKTDKQQDNALVAFLCGALIALVMIVSAFVRGCAPAPVPAYSMCEQCGEVIGEGQHGECNSTRSHGDTEVAYGK